MEKRTHVKKPSKFPNEKDKLKSGGEILTNGGWNCYGQKNRGPKSELNDSV